MASHTDFPDSPGGVSDQTAAGIGDDELHAVEAAIDQVAQECRPALLVLLVAFADAQNLSKTFGIDGTGHQQRNIANLAGPSPLHHDAVEIQIRMLAFDAPIPPRLDFGVDFC